MPYFDRFDICTAHYLAEIDYNVSGILQERPSNQRRNMSSDYQLHRMGFKPGRMGVSFNRLTDNAKEIYSDLVNRYNLPTDSNLELIQWRDAEGITYR